MINRNYHFVVHDSGTTVEELGDMELRGDNAAITFGKLVISELVYKDAGYYNGWTMDITQDKRAVSSVPFK